MKNKLSFITAIVLCLTLALTACKGDGNGKPSDTSSPSNGMVDTPSSSPVAPLSSV